MKKQLMILLQTSQTASFTRSGKQKAESGKEKGVALVFTMIFMGLMVAAALVSVQLASLEQKMAASFRTNQQAFIAAEAALLEAERCVKGQPSCNEITNFAGDCSNGLCFTGTDRSSIISCRAGNVQPWNDASLWTDNSRTIAATTLSTGTSARYIIEFLCYVPKVLFGVTANPSNPGDWSRLYRITVLSSVGDRNSQVMLQTTYKN